MSGAALTLAAFLAMAPRCAPAVHPDTLAPVVQTESRFTLYSIGVNQAGRSIGSRRFASKAEAVAAVERLIASGVTNLDLGPAQISWKAGHLQRRGLTPADAFEPCTALRVAADVLTDCWSRAPARGEQARLDETASCYNTGTFTRGLAVAAGGNGYSAKVRANAEHVVPALRLAGREVPPLPSAPAAPVSPPPPPACAPSWDAWARLACARRTSRPKAAPVLRGGEPTSGPALGGAGTVASNAPEGLRR